MNIVITGDREWGGDRYDLIADALGLFDPEAEHWIVLGDARGVDALARQACTDLELDYMIEKADWERWGKAAGPKRNRAMLSRNVDVVIYFHDRLSESKGTKDCVKQAMALNIPVIDGIALTHLIRMMPT